MRQIPESQVRVRLTQDNPWWDGPAVLPAPYRDWAPRQYLALALPLVRESALNRALVLMGPRRVGKTVLLHHVVGRLLQDGIDPRHLCYVSVDHPIYNKLRLDQLVEHHERSVDLVPGQRRFYFFDEIQYLKDWELQLKSLVDDHPGCQFVVSGSAAAALRLASTESGAGRFTDFLLPPLMFTEFLELTGRSDLVAFTGNGLPITQDIDALNRAFIDYLNHGGYPELALSDRAREDPRRFVKSDIIDKVLLRDLPSLYGVQDIQELNSLFTTLAFNTGGEVSLDELSQNSGVGKSTIRKYIEYLQAAFLIRTVHRVDNTAKRFKRQNFFKVYLTNPSIRTALFDSVEDDGSGALGPLVETGVFAQMFHADVRLHYARWNKGRSEVDLVELRPDQAPSVALEVKWSDRCATDLSGVQPLIRFVRRHRRSTGGNAWLTTRTFAGTRTQGDVSVHCWPVALYCLWAGRTILEGKRAALAGPPAG